ncbi:MAG: hypothetical protein US76_04010 [Parcubacteria group bacterium GW2011_GWA2_38_13b]|nr:MAG: hypothetical protein US76_04010 [Parcubacteria group bacterium GW2011_GWA2_38_13b]
MNKEFESKIMADDNSRRNALFFMDALADVARESFLILDADFRIISANRTFYKTFLFSPEQTEGLFVYDLGNGQWNIPELMNLMKKILPDKKIVRNYEVIHNFEMIGKKIMVLNAIQIDSAQLIILAIEDITARKDLEERFMEYNKILEITILEKTKDLAGRIEELEKINKTMIGRELKMVELKNEIKNLKKKVKNGNGANGNKGDNGNGKHLAHNGRNK